MRKNEPVEKQKLAEKEYYHYWIPFLKVVFLFTS